MTSKFPQNTYPYAEYEQAHQETFAPPQVPIKHVLPPGMSETAFSQAISEFSHVVGKDQVFIGEALAHYIDPYDIWEEDESKRKLPSGAVCPASTDQIRAVLGIANKYGIPLWTFSRGKNLGYGGPAPRVNGSVALDLHRMNKILEVNDEFAYAVVEPGVSWRELIDHCMAHGKKVWPSTPSLSWGSVTGNTLDRGTGFGANSNHHQEMAGLEVILADGDVIRTGQFGINGSPSAFLSKFTYGPSVEGLFVQSNLGVVTKLSILLTPQPPAFMECILEVPELEDLVPMVDTVGRMRRNGLISTCVSFVSFAETIFVRGKRTDFWDGDGPIPDWRLNELKSQFGEGYWIARWGLYGGKRVIKAQFEEIQDIISQELPTATLKGNLFEGEGGKLLDNKKIPMEHAALLTGNPSLFSLPMINWTLPRDGTGKGAHGDYAPIIPNSGKLILEWVLASHTHYKAAGMEPAIDFFMHERHVVMVNMFTYNQRDPKQTANVHQLYHNFHQESLKRGYGMYRAHINHMDLIAGHNNFNNHAYNRFVEKLKDAVDPNGILSPGKQGIWPQKYRHLRDLSQSGNRTDSRL